jgi:hypothetical protein
MEQNSQTKIVASQHEDCPLSFRCLEDWKLREIRVEDGVKFFLRGPLGQAEHLFPAITVRAWPGKGRILSGVSCEWTGRRSAFRTFRLLARTETDLAGIEAIQIDAAHDMPLPIDSPAAKMVTVQERVILALQDGKVYELTYRATQEDFEEHLPVFEALVASFSLGG